MAHPPRLRASITIWALLSWIFLVLPLMSLSIEMPYLLSARMTMVHAARASMQSAWVRCLDYGNYQHGGTIQARAGCPLPTAEALFQDFIDTQTLALAKTATVDNVQFAGSNNDRMQMRICFRHRAIFLGVLGAQAGQTVCIVEQVGLRMRDGP